MEHGLPRISFLLQKLIRVHPFGIRVIRVPILFLLLAACTPQATPTLFIPPTSDATATQPAQIAAATGTPAATAAPTSTPTSLPATVTACINSLSFLQDITVPDGTSVTPGEAVNKQWLVTNNGTCDWNAGYRLKLITGDAMGAPTEEALYPARAGTQATLSIVFHAPSEAGNYSTAWQAVAPDGTTFGEPVFMQINVTTP